MSDNETEEIPGIYIICWKTRNQKWYLDAWKENPNAFLWSTQLAMAMGFKSKQDAFEFDVTMLGSRNIDIEKVELEDFGLVFDI